MCNKLCFISTSLLSYILETWAGTALIWLRWCSVDLTSGCGVAYVGVIRFPNVLTHTEYSDMHFIGWFCSASPRTALVDYQLQYPLCRTKNFKIFENVQGLWERLTKAQVYVQYMQNCWDILSVVLWMFELVATNADWKFCSQTELT
jgi:hypothetical protein